MSGARARLLANCDPASKGWVAAMIEVVVAAATQPLVERIKAMEQVQLLDFVGVAEVGTAYARGTVALDARGCLWIAVSDDDGSSTADLGEPVWRKLSDKRLVSKGSES